MYMWVDIHKPSGKFGRTNTNMLIADFFWVLESQVTLSFFFMSF